MTTDMTSTPAPVQQQRSAAPSGSASASLYVGDLHPEVNEALLFEIFNSVGPVASIRVCRDHATRRSLGYAYVNFHRVQDAEHALDTKNFTLIRGARCRIMWSNRDPSLRKSGKGNIFVKNISKNIDNEALYDTFSVFGNILSCKVATTKPTRPGEKGESLGYGFVHFENEQDAAKAIAQTNGKTIGKDAVVCVLFKSKSERTGGKGATFTNCYVKNLPTKDFDEKKLTEMFSKCGTITSVHLSVDKETKELKGSAFVNFEDAVGAETALKMYHNKEYEGKSLFVGPAMKKEQRQVMLSSQFEKLKIERAKKYAGANLYVKNLSDEINDAKLREIFSPFGAITSTKVAVDSNNGKSRGFGFVCFTSPEEATKAVTEMNGKMINNKPLYVALAQRKEDRRARLAAQYAARNKQAMFQQGAPMFYAPSQQGMQLRPYPPQMMMQHMPRPMHPGVPGMNFVMQPHQRGGRGRGMQRGRGRSGGVQMRGRGGNRVNRGRGKQQQQQQGYKFNQNVRNNRQEQMPVVPVPMPVALPAVEGQNNLSLQQLAAASEDRQREMIGERLFPLIQSRQPTLAGKITGMLLEMDNGELLHLLETPKALDEKVSEAMAVLSQATEPEEASTTEETSAATE